MLSIFGAGYTSSSLTAPGRADLSGSALFFLIRVPGFAGLRNGVQGEGKVWFGLTEGHIFDIVKS